MTYLSPRKSLNKAFLKVKPNRYDIDSFKENLAALLIQTNTKINESEEFHKNNLTDFLKKTYYGSNYYINTQDKHDLVIHNGKKIDSSVGVILETKSPTNEAEMLKLNHLNTKAFQQLIFYYLQERIQVKNLEIKYLIVTNIYQWFIFDASLLDKLFAQNKSLVENFTKFVDKRLSIKTRDLFYQEVAKPAIDKVKDELRFTYFNLLDYQEILLNYPSKNQQAKPRKEDDKKLISLYKILSPQHLLKLPFINDSNSLDKGFYSELLHIIGLTEVKKGSKKLIQRQKEGQRNSGSLLENAIIQLDSLDKISRLKKVYQFGENYQEQLFNVALELVITWINRILFLKLLEAQLISYHQQDKSFGFLNLEKVKSFDDLNSLFFEVLARKNNERNENVREIFTHVPYLNSSLFELSEIEDKTIVISNLKNDQKLPILNSTILKDSQGKKRKGELNTLEYLFQFLDAYDFSSEGSEDIQEENKTLINASVLGLIFEKINGYKDGSFFTPGFITMYMCKETIRRAVLQKFNQEKGWNCETIENLYNKINDLKEANQIINSLKICDPAVGSGHFLVSALNEIIALKSELEILIDRQGKRLKNYSITVENDELIVVDEEGNLFEYNPNNKESQRIQETLFHEKQTIIENCLFGVDININSVKICRLRLWIELLKNAYYKADDELETLPNIDINIKCGNSLISRFAYDTDLKSTLKRSKLTIDKYKEAVQTYRNAENKQQKREMEDLISQIKANFSSVMSSIDPRLNKLRKAEGELNNLLNQTSLFEETKTEKKAREKRQKKLEKEINLLETEIEDIRSNRIYDHAFEWRFEFPEVLNNDGDFIGFDMVIGNPPYIRQEDFSAFKPMLKQKYEIYHSIADLLTYFVELSFNLLKSKGIFQFIISNKFTRANYGQKMRSFLLTNTSLTHFIDFSGLPVFDEATVDAAIVGFIKNHNTNHTNHNLLYANVKKDEVKFDKFTDYIQLIKQNFAQDNLNNKSWTFESEQVLKIKRKIEAQGIPLKDWKITINYGIKTGYNKAFVISGEKRKELIAKDAKSADIIKPILRGRDIQKYYPNFQDLWLIALFPSKKYNIDNFSAIKDYLLSFGKRLEQSGKQGTRKKTNNKWFETSDNIAYWQDFEKPKIIYPELTKFLVFILDNEAFYTNNKNFILTGEKIYWLVSFLNSYIFKYCFRDNFPELLGGTRELRKVFFEQIPVKQITEKQEKPFKELVTQILNAKKADSNADTSELERQIDKLVYELYGLTEEEIKIVEESTN